jgi:diguanylate cyclase (GGDEF)-like protein
MESQELLCLALAGALSSALLWLAGEISALAAARPARRALVLTTVSVLLAACGLWWPVHLLPAEGTLAAAPGPAALVAWLPALLLSMLAAGTAIVGRAGHLPAAVLGCVATLSMAYGLSMLTAPGLLRLSHLQGQLGAGAATLVLAVAMVVLHVRRGAPRTARWGRALAAVAAASVVCVSTASAPHLLLTRLPGWWPELSMLVVLIALAAALLYLLPQAVDGKAEALVRPGRPASVDSLTGLPTRLYFEGRLASAAKKAQDQRSRLAVFFIDLDGFKPINDTYGHSCGDRVLEQVGRRLKAISRGADVAARVGGDEFLMLMSDAGSQEAVAQVGQRLINALSRPYRVDEREVAISCSVGIALYPDGCSQRKLIARADVAMYAAKRAGGSRLCFYAPDMDANAQQNFDLVRDLREAIVKNELELYFQPKIDAHSGKVTAAEALLRWQHPKLGLLMPEQFVTLAERSGLIGPLGNWVIEASCKQARAWRDKGLRMRVAINLSAHQMRQDDICERIAETLKRYRIHPSLLTCEITESAAMEDTRATQLTFRRLGELGTHLSIDDFGTGYSSLSYLRQLPAEELKIDRSFVLDLEASTDARAVVDAVVKLAHALGLKVVAEGVETPRQQQILIELGCDELQGYLFARPMTARALLLWALGDRQESAAFRNSLFGETRQATVMPLDEEPEADLTVR